jgi:RsiW-degrading membrane proteinase PrsW (M82 family)
VTAPGPVPAPALAQVAERRIRFQGRAVRVLAIIGLVLAGLVTLLVVGIDAGPVPFVTGLVLATVPVPIYVFLALRIDRFEPEPVRLLAWAFFWGATGAVFIALVLNTAGQAIVGSQFGADVGELYGGSVSAPLVEESAKGFVLLLIYRWRRWRLDSVLDGIVYAAMVGLGFAMTENVLYYSNAAAGGGVPLGAVFFLRGVLQPFGHPVFTSMTGIGLAVAATTDRRWLRAVAPFAGWAGAVGLHSLWNTSATVGGGIAFVGVYFLIMVPLFFGLICVALVSMRREGRVVSEYLRPEVAAGTLTAGDVELLSSLRNRRRLVKAARRDSRAARRAARAFQLAATELAFHRRRAARGLPLGTSDPVTDEATFTQALEALSRNLGPHVQRLRGQMEEAMRWRADYATRLANAAPPATPALPAAPVAAWYPDPWGQGRVRWWDGRAWTGHVSH